MKAIFVSAPGVEPLLGQLPRPKITANSVLIRVVAAGLNAFDNAIAGGFMSGMMPHEYPITLGRDVSGTVEEVGESVDHVQVGDRVLGHILFQDRVHDGTLAEFALVPGEATILLPDSVSFEQGAALPLAATAAAAVVKGSGAKSGQVFAVNGATGGVGSYVVQLLAAAGVTVVGTGGPDDRDRLLKLGCTHVVDYTAGSVNHQVLALIPGGVDGLVELVAQSTDASPSAVVKDGGIVVTTTGHPDPETLDVQGLRHHAVFARANRDALTPLAALAAAGSLRIDVNDVVRPNQALDALQRISQGRARGKTVVRFID